MLRFLSGECPDIPKQKTSGYNFNYYVPNPLSGVAYRLYRTLFAQQMLTDHEAKRRGEGDETDPCAPYSERFL